VNGCCFYPRVPPVAVRAVGPLCVRATAAAVTPSAPKNAPQSTTKRVRRTGAVEPRRSCGYQSVGGVRVFQGKGEGAKSGRGSGRWMSDGAAQLASIFDGFPAHSCLFWCAGAFTLQVASNSFDSKEEKSNTMRLECKHCENKSCCEQWGARDMITRQWERRGRASGHALTHAREYAQRRTCSRGRQGHVRQCNEGKKEGRRRTGKKNG